MTTFIFFLDSKKKEEEEGNSTKKIIQAHLAYTAIEQKINKDKNLAVRNILRDKLNNDKVNQKYSNTKFQ